MDLNIYPGDHNRQYHPRHQSSSTGTLVLAFFALSSLFSVLAFLIALLALIK